MKVSARRSARELKAAADEAGWGGDPLADEILAALNESEQQVATGPSLAEAAVQQKRARMAFAAALLGLIVGGASAMVAVSASRSAADAARRQSVAEEAAAKANGDFALIADRLTKQQAVLDSTLKAAAASDTNVQALIITNKALQEAMQGMSEQQRSLEELLKTMRKPVEGKAEPSAGQSPTR